MRYSLLTGISVTMLLMIMSFAVQANPSLPISPAPLLLKGPRLSVDRMDEIDSSILNGSWKDIAQALRVRDLRVYSYSDSGSPNLVQKRVLSQMEAAGYSISKFSWKPQTGVSGFYAKRGKEVIGAIWRDSTRLYWGYVAPVTAQTKFDDGLINAARDGDLNAAKKFLAKGASPFAKDYSGDSVLKVAADQRRVHIIKLLLNAFRIYPSASSFNEILGALKVASYKNYADVVQVFLDNGLTPYQIGIAMKMAVSFGAGNSVYDGSIDVVKVLLPVASQYDIDSALVIAADVAWWRGEAIQYSNTAKLLLTKRPSQTAINNALIAAAPGDQGKLIPMLLSAGADVNAQDKNGDTALSLAARDVYYYAGDQNVLALLKAGANPNIKTNKGETALMHAAIANSSSVVKLLLSYGADPNARNNTGMNIPQQVQEFLKNARVKSTRDRLTENMLLIKGAMKKDKQ